MKQIKLRDANTQRRCSTQARSSAKPRAHSKSGRNGPRSRNSHDGYIMGRELQETVQGTGRRVDKLAKLSREPR